jgi:hypothetical protein
MGAGAGAMGAGAMGAGAMGAGAMGAGATGAGATGAGAMGAGAIGAGAAPLSGVPQCWQNLYAPGVCPPQDGQVILAGCPAGGGSRGDPHILQNFIPGALSVPQELHTGPIASSSDGFLAPGVLAPPEDCGLVRGASGGVSGVPHAWQKREPSLLSLPQLEQRAMEGPSYTAQQDLLVCADGICSFTKPETCANRSSRLTVNSGADSPLLTVCCQRSTPAIAVRKLPIRLLAVNGVFIFCLGVCLGACGPIIKVAPYGQRPDSIVPGSLLGPFDGQVVDADTGSPLADVVVSCTWAFDRGLGSTAPEAVRTYSTATNVDGRYVVPALRSLPTGLTARLARLSFVVYKKEYVAFRQDRVFNYRGTRVLFSQQNNVVRLSRWSPELSRARHLLFIGGGAALSRASEWEVLAAAAELDGQARGAVIPRDLSVGPALPAAKARLDAAVLLSTDEVRAVTGYEGAFTVGKLTGPRSSSYDTHHLRAVDKPERYDVAIRLWRLASGEVAQKYEEILKALPNSKQTDEIGDRSFVVTQGEILGIGLMDRTASAVVLLTCGRGQCSKDKHLTELAKLVEKNLGKLPSIEEEEGKEAPKPAAPLEPKLDDGEGQP